MPNRKRSYAPDSQPILEQVPTNTRDSQLNVRPIFAKLHPVTNSNGSAYLETGTSKVICTVQIRSIKTSSYLSCDFKFAPFSGGKRRPYMKVSAKLLTFRMKKRRNFH